MARVGAARVFFDIVGTFQAQSLLGDTEAATTAQQAILLDAIGGISEAFDEMSQFILQSTQVVVDAFFEHEEQLIRVRKFYSGATEEVERFANASIGLGEAFGFSGDQALAASARTAQLKGVLESQEAIIEATRGGLLMAQVGEMETEMGMNRFIALAQQTQFMYGGLTKAQYDALDAEQQANIVRGNSIRVLDQLNTVENSSVAIMEDITFVLNQFASQADIAGESIGDMAAMSALLLETGEEVSRAGTGLRMIYQRIGNENSDAVKALQELMGGVDSSVITQMKLSEIIGAIGDDYANMTGEQKRNLAVSIAGSRHYVKFLKLMENQPRLLELQTAAYRGQFGAIEEFENKADSLFFKQQQQEAIVKNLQVEIGDKLADAYMTGALAQEAFLRGMDKITDFGIGEDVVKNFIQLSSVYQQIIAPMTNVGMQALNMVIAFKTLQAVIAASNPEFFAQAQGYRRTRQEMQFLSAATNEFSINSVINMDRAALSANNYNDRVVEMRMVQSILNDEMTETSFKINMVNAATTAMHGAMGKTKMIFVDTSLAASGMMNVESGALLTLENMYQQHRATLLDVDAKRSMINVKIGQYMALSVEERNAILQTNIFNAQGTAGIVERNKAQTTLNDTMAREVALLNSTLTLSRPLTAVEKQGINNEIVRNNATMTTNQTRINAINTTLLLSDAESEFTAEITGERAALQANNTTLQQRNATLRTGLLASKQAEQANRQYAASVLSADGAERISIGTRIKLTATNMKAAFSLKAINSALMPISMILPFIVDSEHQMEAIMASVAITAFTMAIPAMSALGAQMKANGVAATVMTGGLNIAAAALITFAAYMGVKAFAGDGFMKNALGNVEEFNAGIIGANDILATLGERTEDIYGGVVDKTYRELSQEGLPAMTDALSDLRMEYDDLDSALSVAEKGTSHYNQLLADRKAVQDAITNVDALARSYERQAALTDALANDYEADITITESLSYRNENARILGLQTKAYAVEYTDIYGNMHRKVYDTEEEALTARNKLQEKYNQEALAHELDYVNAFITNMEKKNADVIAGEQGAQEILLGDAYAFANAREELFFGANKAGFTGALMKQITQGGVENLLYKTEIVQTNVFNGMTLPEMVEEVSKGVLAELENTGVLS